MNERLKEFLNQQLDTCRTAISSNPDALQKEFWEGRELANKLALLHIADILDMDRLHRLHEPCVCNSGFIVKKNWLDKLLEWLTQW